MATSIARRSTTPSIRLSLLRHLSSVSHHNEHIRNQEYLKSSSFVGSWETPKDPKEALARLAHLRRDYAKQVKELRKQYIYEMELNRQEQIRKDEARRLEILQKREERNKSKAEAAVARAAERKAFQDQFRQTLMNERAQKLDYWKKRQEVVEGKKKSKKELVCKQSSMWIDEEDLEKTILNAVIDVTTL